MSKHAEQMLLDKIPQYVGVSLQSFEFCFTLYMHACKQPSHYSSINADDHAYLRLTSTLVDEDM